MTQRGRVLQRFAVSLDGRLAFHVKQEGSFVINASDSTTRVFDLTLFGHQNGRFIKILFWEKINGKARVRGKIEKFQPECGKGFFFSSRKIIICRSNFRTNTERNLHAMYLVEGSQRLGLSLWGSLTCPTWQFAISYKGKERFKLLERNKIKPEV